MLWFPYSSSSRLLNKWLRGVAQSGSAPGLGPGGRRFESCRPDFFLKRQPSIWLSLFFFFRLKIPRSKCLIVYALPSIARYLFVWDQVVAGSNPVALTFFDDNQAIGCRCFFVIVDKYFPLSLVIFLFVTRWSQVRILSPRRCFDDNQMFACRFLHFSSSNCTSSIVGCCSCLFPS